MFFYEKLKKTLIFGLIFVIFAAGCKKEEDKTDNTNTGNTPETPATPDTPENPNTVKDIDGNIYKTVKINGLTWMAENLKVEKLNDGTAISKATSVQKWIQSCQSNQPTYCYYDCQDANKDVHGALYNGYAAETGKLCPQGWHIPTKAEWEDLITFIGGNYGTAGKLMTTTGWTDGYETIYGTDDYGFSAKASGFIYVNQNNEYKFDDLGASIRFFNSDVIEEYYYIYDRNIYSQTGQNYQSLENGNSVRCVKD